MYQIFQLDKEQRQQYTTIVKGQEVSLVALLKKATEKHVITDKFLLSLDTEGIEPSTLASEICYGLLQTYAANKLREERSRLMRASCTMVMAVKTSIPGYYLSVPSSEEIVEVTRLTSVVSSNYDITRSIVLDADVLDLTDYKPSNRSSDIDVKEFELTISGLKRDYNVCYTISYEVHENRNGWDQYYTKSMNVPGGASCVIKIDVPHIRKLLRFSGKADCPYIRFLVLSVHVGMKYKAGTPWNPLGAVHMTVARRLSFLPERPIFFDIRKLEPENKNKRGFTYLNGKKRRLPVNLTDKFLTSSRQAQLCDAYGRDFVMKGITRYKCESVSDRCMTDNEILRRVDWMEILCDFEEVSYVRSGTYDSLCESFPFRNVRGAGAYDLSKHHSSPSHPDEGDGLQ